MPYLGNYTGAPSVEPDQGAKAAYLRDSATPEAFGVGVDQAQQNLDKSLGQAAGVAGDWASKLQDQYNQGAITDLENQYTRATAEKTAQFMQLRGKDALAAAPDYYKFLDTQRQTLMASAPNSAVAREADRHLSRVAAGLYTSGVQHQAQQAFQYNQDETRSRIALSTDQAGANSDDLVKFNDSLAKIEGDTVRLFASNGHSADDATTQQAVRENLTKAWQNRWTSLASQGKADQAMKEYDSRRDKILDPDDRIYTAINTAQVSQFADRTSKVLVAGRNTPEAVGNAIWGQESGFGKNARTSIDGARGDMQILPATFKQYAQPGESIDNPEDNKKVGQRIIEDYYQKYNGDAARVAVAYFSGPGNVAPEGSKTPWINDAKDGNGKATSSYVQDVLTRMGSTSNKPVSPTEINGLVQQARLQAGAKFPDDPKAQDVAEQAVRQRFNLQKQDYTNAANEATYAMRDKIYGPTDQDPNARPPTREQLMNDPVFKANYDSIGTLPNGAQLQDRVNREIQRNINNVQPSPQRDDNFTNLKGIADSDPARFKDMDLSKEDLTRAQASQLHQEQKKITTVSQGKPDLSGSITLLKHEGFFTNINMKPSTASAPNPQYDTFIGQLNRQIEIEQGSGRKPTPEFVRKTAAMLATNMSQTPTKNDEGQWKAFGGGDNMFYQMPVPSDVRTNIINGLKQRGQPVPSESQIRDIYNRLRLQQARSNPELAGGR